MAEEKKEKEGKEKPKGQGLLLIILVLLVLVLGVLGFIAWKLVSTPPRASSAAGEAPPAAAPKEDEGPPVLIEMQDVTVNLADADATRFLRAKIKLEVRGEKAKKKVEENMVKIRDLVITVLGGKTFDEVRTPHGKFALKEELVYRINRLLGENLVRNLYFVEFVAQ